MIYERSHTRQISDFGGVTKVMPVFATFFLIITLSSLGLPGTNGFVGEFLILVGSYQVAPVFTILATVGIIFAAAYLLWMFLRVMFGPITNEKNKLLVDLNGREIGILIPIVLMIFWIGIYPSTFLKKTEATAAALIENVQKAKAELQIEQNDYSFSNLFGLLDNTEETKSE
jgi:NADH-quinone oxidoreductase subunit M